MSPSNENTRQSTQVRGFSKTTAVIQWLVAAGGLAARQPIIPQCGAGFWFVTQAHPPAHIGMCAGGWNAGDGPKDKQEVELLLAEALRSHPPGPSIAAAGAGAGV
jgi:hypothetical protein